MPCKNAVGYALGNSIIKPKDAPLKKPMTLRIANAKQLKHGRRKDNAWHPVHFMKETDKPVGATKRKSACLKNTHGDLL
jgi:hypothetical protein